MCLRKTGGNGVGMAAHRHPVDPDRVTAARTGQLRADEAERLTQFVGLLSDPVRARVIDALLAAEELCVGDVALALDISEDAATYALRVLRTAGVVDRRRQGRLGYYRIIDGGGRQELATALTQLRRLADVPPRSPAHDPADPDPD